MKSIRFVKMEASGNDFIVIDNRRKRFPAGLSSLARKLCRRKLGIGADGLLVVEKSRRADFRMRIFNPDGSEAEMCGNGSRCLILYARLMKINSGKTVFETLAGVLEGRTRGNLVRVKLPGVRVIRLDFALVVGGRKLKMSFLDSGVPHAVVPVKDVTRVEVAKLGRAIRFHRCFRPKGTNVDFVEIKKNLVKVRTYERGVEEETLSCGTGSVASAIAAAILTGMAYPVRVHTASGEILKVYFDLAAGRVENIWLEGNAGVVFAGEVNV